MTSTQQTITKAFIYLALLLGGIVMIMPLVWMLSTASKSLQETLIPEFRLLPSQFMLIENLKEAFLSTPMLRFFRNSIMVTLSVTLGVTLAVRDPS